MQVCAFIRNLAEFSVIHVNSANSDIGENNINPSVILKNSAGVSS